MALIGAMNAVKTVTRASLCRHPIASIFSPLTYGFVPVFMLHRFADPEQRHRPGHDPARLRDNLEHLRRHGYRFLSLAEMLRLLVEEPQKVRRAVVFTVDDGYDDFRRLGWPVFAAYDCPVTVFVSSGFLDGTCSFWWDRTEYAIRQRRRGRIVLDVGRRRATYAWSGDGEMDSVISTLQTDLKAGPESERRAALEQIAEQTGVAWPETPPPGYRPLTWDDVRSLGDRGVTFGPHSVTHPILSQMDDARAEEEITRSWERVRAETKAVVPVFCYPNGRREDFGIREMDVVRRLGFVGALGSEPGLVSTASLRGTPYALPRFAYPEERDRLIQVVCGMERALAAIRPR